MDNTNASVTDSNMDFDASQLASVSYLCKKYTQFINCLMFNQLNPYVSSGQQRFSF